MLNQLRSLAGNLAAKILLVLLVLSFVIWGVGDMVRHPGGAMTVATVGSKNISLSEYQYALRREVENIRQIAGDRYSPEFLKKLRVEDHVLRQLVDKDLLKLESQSLGLVPSNTDVVRRIRSNLTFQDAKGNFDKNIFEAMLRNGNVSEKTYIDQLRQDMAANMLMETLTGAVALSPTAALTLFAVREEQRNAVIYTVSPSLATAGAQPDTAALQAYYTAHLQDFSVPEYRTVSYISFKNNEIPASFALSEDDLKNAYKERIDEFRKPERRIVNQLLYNNLPEAKKAYDALNAGTPFEQVAKTTPIINKNAVSLGAIERGRLSQEAENAVFALHIGQFTPPIQTPFGWHIFQIGDIRGASIASFEEARPVLEKDMKQHGADDAINKISNKIEDALAGGSNLQETASDLGFKVRTVGPFGIQGQTPDGHTARDLPDFDRFLEIAFKTEEKSESPLTPAKDGTYYLLHVDSVTPEHARPLAEVKDEVTAGWRKEERGKSLAELADSIAKKMSDKASRGSVIGEYHLQPAFSPTFKRTDKTSLPPMLVSDIFTHQPGEITRAYAAKDGSYLIAEVKDIVPAPVPDPKNKELGAIYQELSSNQLNEIVAEYMHYLATKYSVSLNESLLNSLEQNAAER